MKQIVVIAFIGALTVSCSKKQDKSYQDSNIMLPEPEVNVKKDSVASAEAVSSVVSAETVAKDSTAVK
ncbi:MAG: hypothetical protein QM564_08510 [Bergeyella sp.]